MSDVITQDRLSPIFSALADPTRRAILTRLTQGDATVAELGAPFAMSQPAVSKHLRVLEQAGLISRSRVATARYSHLEAAPMRQASEWMQQYRELWIGGFERLDAALADYLGPTDRIEPAEDNEPAHHIEEDPS